jgi:hypothetical protein
MDGDPCGMLFGTSDVRYFYVIMEIKDIKLDGM